MVTFRIPVPEPLELDGENPIDDWMYFRQRYEHYEVAADLNNKRTNERISAFLSIIGAEGLRCYDDLSLSTDKRANMKSVLDAIEDHIMLLCESGERTERQVQQSEYDDETADRLKQKTDTAEMKRIESNDPEISIEECSDNAYKSDDDGKIEHMKKCDHNEKHGAEPNVQVSNENAMVSIFDVYSEDETTVSTIADESDEEHKGSGDTNTLRKDIRDSTDSSGQLLGYAELKQNLNDENSALNESNVILISFSNDTVRAMDTKVFRGEADGKMILFVDTGQNQIHSFPAITSLALENVKSNVENKEERIDENVCFTDRAEKWCDDTSKSEQSLTMAQKQHSRQKNAMKNFSIGSTHDLPKVEVRGNFQATAMMSPKIVQKFDFERGIHKPNIEGRPKFKEKAIRRTTRMRA